MQNINVGEMNPEQIKETVLNKSTRKLIKVNANNLKEAIALIADTAAKKHLMTELGIIDLNNSYTCEGLSQHPLLNQQIAIEDEGDED